MHTKTFPIIYCHPMRIEFGNCVRTARIEGGSLALNWLLNHTEHFRATGLVKAYARVYNSNCLKQVNCTQSFYLAGQYRLIPRYLNEALRTQIIYLLRSN